MMGDECAHADGFYVFWPYSINVDCPWFFATISFPTLTQIFPRLKQKIFNVFKRNINLKLNYLLAIADIYVLKNIFFFAAAKLYPSNRSPKLSG